MFTAKKLVVKENLSELKALQRTQAAHLQARVQMLVLIKKDLHHTKAALGQALGIHYTTIQDWKTAYDKGGLQALLTDGRSKGHGRPGQVDELTSQAIKVKLADPTGNITSYKDLQQWVEDTLGKHINYQPLRLHVKNHYGAKLKVARKSHIAKDIAAIETFKKN